MQTPKDRYSEIRENILFEFRYISTKELQEVLRCFTNIKTLLTKPEDEQNIRTIKNKMICLTNIFEKDFIRKKFRRDTDQRLHPKLNSVMCYSGVIGYSSDKPFDLEFYKKLDC